MAVDAICNRTACFCQEDEVDEKKTPSPRDAGERSGGVNFYGAANVGGDVVGRDKNVYGDEIQGDKVGGDKIEGQIGNAGSSAQVAIGKQIQQTIRQDPVELTAAERAEIEHLLTDLKHQLANLDLPQETKLVGQAFVAQLEQELTKSDEPPDAPTLKAAGDWLLDHLPALAGALARLFANPITGKVVAAAGDGAAAWVKERFGHTN
jgi:hypothetical protein